MPAFVQALQNIGACIKALNTVRKHISACKGGQLAAAAHPGKVIALVLSDVCGDPLESIASGPTVCDPSSFANALDILEQCPPDGIMVPESVMQHVRAGVRGEVPETPKAGDKRMENSVTLILGSNSIAAEAARVRAEELGYVATVHSVMCQGDADDAVNEVNRHRHSL